MLSRILFYLGYRKNAGQVSWLQYINPDGSKGPLVPENAEIGDGAYLEPGAVVWPGTKVLGNQRVKNGDILLSERTIARLD
ncbi:hypothetical protein [Kordiimonas sp.]|uniref:hypothetical protein n=1 Tax=Kordiimonas sp. TaxID=1970157 RepID=UPI003A8EA0CA